MTTKKLTIAKRKKWPIGTIVATLTPEGYLNGVICRRTTNSEKCDGVIVNFRRAVDMGIGLKFYHAVPFRNLRKVGFDENFAYLAQLGNPNESISFGKRTR